MKRYLIITIAVIGCITFVSGLMQADIVFTPEKENDFIKTLKQKFEVFNKKIPQDRIYLHTDKTFYSPGETLWFSAYVRDAATMKASTQSDIVQVQLISPKGNVENTYKLICKNGMAAGDFSFAEGCPGGIYKIKAFTNWQKNEPDSLFFEKEITVQDVVVPRLKMKLDFDRKAYGAGDEVIAKLNLESNDNKVLANYPFEYVVQIEGNEIARTKAVTGNEGIMHLKFKLPKNLDSNDGLLNVMLNYDGINESISRSIPIVLNKIALKFYPEGGDLVAGIPNKVAFKALNEFGKPADIEGNIVDGEGNIIGNFSSYHQGMGAFVLPCVEGVNYIAKITKPKGIEQDFALPEMLDHGYVMNLTEQNSTSLQLAIQASAKEELSLIAQVRGKIYYSTSIDVINGVEKVNIPVSMLPFGVCQLTLFDSKGIARCERLVFVNQNKQLNVSITTDKEKYLPREKVTANISVTDENGMPVSTHLSLSVTNDELLSFADDKQGNILSQLFLEQDVKGKIEEPAFYFTKAPKALQGLDYVMMTSGWRRFTWEPIVQNQSPYINFSAEKAVVKGTVIDNYSGKPVTDAIIKIGNLQMQTNEKGIFIAKHLDITQACKLVIEMPGYAKYEELLTDYNDQKVIYLQNNKVKPVAVAENLGMRAFDNVEMDVQMAAPAMNFAFNAGAPAPKQVKMVPQERGKAKQNKVKPEKAAAKAELKKEKEINALLLNDEVVMAEEDMKPIGNAKFKKNIRDEEIPAQPTVKYYRARQFDTPDYSTIKSDGNRTDFRKTIYWNPNIAIDKTGKKTISFYTNDEIASFRFIAEGIGSNGSPAHAEKQIFTQLPFAMSVKMPLHLIQDDEISIPLVLKNNSSTSLKGKLSVSISQSMLALEKLPEDINIPALESKTILLKYKVGEANENAKIELSFNAGEVSDAFEQNFKIHAKGFPVNVSFSGKETNKAYTVDITNMVKGSLVASATAYPSVVSDLMKGVESILREPGGCFEQTSMSSYPNIMVRDYLTTIGQNDPKIEARANELIERGYKKLIAFETKEKGYEWFGGAPGHEALTAYGLMQFNDMKKVYNGVDQNMIDRTANWLMASKDGKGGYKRNPRALDNFGGANQNITDAYITYALACANYENIKTELDHIYEEAKSSKDAYVMGLAVNALFAHHKDKRAVTILNDLLKKQEADGSFMGAFHSITRSTDKALRVETTSLAILAMLQSDEINANALNKAVDYLTKARSGYGDFGNTQSTIMALKALTQFANYAKQTNEDGVLEMYVGGKKVAEQGYKAGERDAIVINGIEKYLTAGKNKLELKYRNAKNPLPYSIAVSWNTDLPQSAQECMVNLKVNLNDTKVKTGETVRLNVKLENKTNQGLPSTMAIIGIPSGCSAQPWQLKEMQDKKIIDYYEISGNQLNIYYRQMAPNEIKTLNFDLKAEVQGKFLSPASSAYLYYTNEYKEWQSLQVLEII
jgi:alpha-2-macroglobulin-like protein